MFLARRAGCFSKHSGRAGAGSGRRRPVNPLRFTYNKWRTAAAVFYRRRPVRGRCGKVVGLCAVRTADGYPVLRRRARRPASIDYFDSPRPGRCQKIVVSKVARRFIGGGSSRIDPTETRWLCGLVPTHALQSLERRRHRRRRVEWVRGRGLRAFGLPRRRKAECTEARHRRDGRLRRLRSVRRTVPRLTARCRFLVGRGRFPDAATATARFGRAVPRRLLLSRFTASFFGRRLRRRRISASRRVETPSRHRRDSWPSHDDVGGFLLRF